MFLKDLVYAGRVLRKSPLFAATAAITIALGIGAATAIFSVTNAVLVESLPYKDADRLVLACADLRKRNVKDFPMSNADFMDLRRGATANFEEFGAVFTFRNTMPREDGTSEQVKTANVTPNLLRLLGAKVVVGRDFEDADAQPQPPQAAAGQAGAQALPQLPAIAILSHEYWQRRYGESTAVLGHRMLNGGQGGPLVVGVLAPGFELLFPPSANVERLPDVWIANRMSYDAAQRNDVQHHAIGKLKRGATLEAAQSEVENIAAEIRRIDAISATAGYHLRLEPMHQHLVAEVRPAILALMGAVMFLLLIACANVANLLLVRASLRERELAVRTALGGSRWRLVRQMLAEALLLASIGAALGVGLAWAGVRELLAIAPENLPRLDTIRIDPVVLAFAALAALVATALFGIAPALRASRPDLIGVLRASGRTAGLGAGGLRNGVVVAEVALSFVLLVGSGLMFRSFLALQHIDPGFDAHHLLTFQVLGPQDREPAHRAATMRQIRDRLRELPGVESVAAAAPFPLAGGFGPIRWGMEPALADASKFQATDFQIVLPGYFEAMHTPLIAGRAFTDDDNAPGRKVVIVDTALAAKAYPGQSAVGKRILIRIATPQPEWVEIIGVAAHQRAASLAEPGREQIWLTDGFLDHGAVNRWAIRTAGDPASYAATVRSTIRSINPKLLVNEVEPMETLVRQAQSGTRFQLLLIGVFAVIAALLAGVGLYGVLASVVRQRTAEIGVRMALGAEPVKIFRLVVGQGLRLSAAGIAVGVLAALVLTRVMTSMLVGVEPTDPVTFAAIVVLFFAIAIIGCWIPARRAAGLDPTVALRQE